MTDLHESDSELATKILEELTTLYPGQLTAGVIRALIAHLEWLIGGEL